MTAGQTDNNEAIRTLANNIVAKFPLITASVEVGSRNWKVACVQNQDALVDAVDDLEHMPYGFLLWESAIGLARYVHQNSELFVGKKVLELGCGVGLPGLVAQSVGAEVVQTDHQPGVLSLARHNAQINKVTGVRQIIADWTDWNVKEQFDMIIGADIMYERAMHSHLEQVFRSALKKSGTLLVADPGRLQALENMAVMERRGWKMSMKTIPVRAVHEGPQSKKVDVAVVTAQLEVETKR